MSEWDCGSIGPLPGVPRVWIVDGDGKRLFKGYYIYRVKRQLCPFGDRLHPEDVDHLVAVENEADWNLPKTMTIKKVTPPHRIELIEPLPERTCRNTAGEPFAGYREFGCSECGAHLEVDGDTDANLLVGGERPMPNYCPNCGARVVER